MQVLIVGSLVVVLAISLWIVFKRSSRVTQLLLMLSTPFVHLWFRQRNGAALANVFISQHLKIRVISGWLGTIYRPLLGFEVRGYVAPDEEPLRKVRSISSLLDRQIALAERTSAGHLRFYFSGPGFSHGVAKIKATKNRVIFMRPSGKIEVEIAKVTPSIVLAARSGWGKTTAIRSLVAPFAEARKIYVGRNIDEHASGEMLQLTDAGSLQVALECVINAVSEAAVAEKSGSKHAGLRLILILDEFSNWSVEHRPAKGDVSWQDYVQKIINETCRKSRILVITTSQSGRAGTLANDSMAMLCGELTAAGQAKVLTGVEVSLPCLFSYYSAGFHGAAAGVVVLPNVVELAGSAPDNIVGN